MENEVFFVSPDEDRKDAEWVLISLPINKFSLGCSADDGLSGYIHHSRIKFLKDLSENKSSDFSFKYNLKHFDKGEHIIQYNEGKFVTFVDGRHPWGTDGGLPKTEVKTIQVSYKGKSYRVSESLYGDIYECSNRFKVYTKNEVYFIYQMNSDGAGAYEIVWVLQRRV